MLSGVRNGDLRFGDFRLEPAERRLSRNGEAVELNARYLDALLLLAASPGELVTKDRFMAEVWRGVPVTDEALTQCIRSLRRALGDDASRPRFIETVPRHGYRFIAEVRAAEAGAGSHAPLPGTDDRAIALPSPLLLSAAGLIGGAAAGLFGGLGYGFLAATNPPPGTGAISIVLVMTCLCMGIGLLGGLGVGGGIAAARRLSTERLFPAMLGGAIGGFAVGAVGRLIGLDAFALLIGSRPVAITGAGEGLVIGALGGASVWLARGRAPANAMLIGAGLGALAGLLVTAGGGQMMASSLATLAAAHPEAPLGSLMGGELSLATRFATAALEGATFIAALTAAMTYAARKAPPTA